MVSSCELSLSEAVLAMSGVEGLVMRAKTAGFWLGTAVKPS